MTFPAPYELLIGASAVTPLVALALVGFGRGDYSLAIDMQGRTGSELWQPESLGWLFVGPASALATRALLDLSLLDLGISLGWGSGAAILVLGISLAVDRRARGLGAAAWMSVVAFAYGWGAAAEANVLLDRSRPLFHSATLTAKREGSDAYYLNLDSPRIPQAGGEREVAREMFEHARVGEQMCLRVYRGALHARWYEIGFCPPAMTLRR